MRKPAASTSLTGAGNGGDSGGGVETASGGGRDGDDGNADEGGGGEGAKSLKQLEEVSRGILTTMGTPDAKGV